MIIIGIDPGLTGAIAILSDLPHVEPSIEDMPVADGSIDPAGLSALLANYDDARMAYVERVSAMPKQGVSSTFKFGTGYGMVLGVLAALEIPYALVTPGVWKKAYGLSSDKEQCRARALQLFPALAGDMKRKKDHGRAEALLIAEWGRRQRK